MSEQEQRAAIVKEALTWLKTPFIHGARLKGVGADCETFIGEVFHAVGIFDARNIPYVPEQWFLNTKVELYLNYLAKYATEYPRPAYNEPPPRPGDVICVKHRHVYAHAAIIVQWPKVIHCHPPRVTVSDVFYNPAFSSGMIKFFNPWLLKGKE